MENLNIEEFNPKKAELVALAESCKDLVIMGVEDKEGYELVNNKRKELKAARVELTKTGKRLRDGAISFQRAVIEKEKEFVAIIEPLEIELENKQKAIDEEKEKIARMELLPERKEKLFKIGVEYTDDEILSMTDIEFHTFLNDKTTEFLAEKERLLEEARIKEEERKLKEAEDKAEQERLAKQKEQDDIKEKQRLKELEEAKDKAAKDAIINAQKEKDEAIKKEKEEAAKREQAIRDEQEAKEKARIQKEVEDRIAKERKEAEERALQEKIDKDKKWKDFLVKSGWTKENENEFYILQNGNTRTIYKKVGEITI